MTDERRHDDRRTEDMRLAEAVSAANYANADHSHDEIIRLIEVLEGKAHLMPSGLVMREGGLISEVAALTKRLSNGGINVKLPVGAWVAIGVAIIAGLAQVAAAIVSTPAP